MQRSYTLLIIACTVLSVSLYSVCVCVRACVRACVCVCACVCIFCIVTLEPLLMSTVCVRLIYFIFIAVTFSISMYVMRVILCLFSALSRRIGALQISVSIIINVNVAAI